MCIIIYLYIILFSIILVIFMTEKEVIERIGKKFKKERKRQKGNGRKKWYKKKHTSYRVKNYMKHSIILLGTIY